MKKAIPFTILSKTIKYLEINLTKEVKYLYTKNDKTLMKEIEEDKNKWDIPCSRIRRINIIKILILFSNIHTEFIYSVFVKIPKRILKFV